MGKYSILQEDALRQCKKRIFVIAVAGFFAGLVAANTFAKGMLLDMGIFGDYFIMQLSGIQIDSHSMLWYVFERRMFFVLVVVLFSVTKYENILVSVLAGWLGICVGMLLTLAVLQQGFSGIGLCIVGLFPQYLLYIPAGMVLVLKSCRLSIRLQEMGGGIGNGARRDFYVYILVCLGVVVVFFVGIFLESYLNPIICKKFIKILTISGRVGILHLRYLVI